MVFGALRTGLTGLRVNQRYLEVIGNNLTNSDTFGFKSDRVTFSDVLYQTARAPTGPSSTLGGTNGLQVGFGARVGSIDQLHTQGALVTTGRNFDLALQGAGFFVLNDGTQNVYSRVGTFTLDREANLVDSRTGYQVQNLAGQGIQIDTSSIAPAKATTSIDFAGNLPAKITGPLAEIQESTNVYEDHQPALITAAPAGATVDLTSKDLVLTVDAAPNVTLSFTAADTGGGAQTLTAAAATINAKLATQNVSPSITARVNGGGQLELVTDSTGGQSFLRTTGTAAVELGTDGSQANGAATTAVAATRLDDLNANTADYTAGDIIQISGVDTLGQTVNVSFTYGAANDGETLGDLVNKVAGAFPNATVTLDQGKIKLASNTTGESNLAVVIKDGIGNATGASGFGAFDTVVRGTDADTRATSITVFDSLGISHTMSGIFERQDNGSWNFDLSIPQDEGSVSGSPITGITFGPDGTLQGVGGTSVDISYTNGASTQNLTIDLGKIGGLTGLTQFGDASTAQAIRQDGFESGTLATLAVTQNGTIQGFYGNGEVVDIDTVAVAQFQNQSGLLRGSGTLFLRTDNSGIPLVGQAGLNGAGTVVAGTLEGSNVDTATEFVRLIEAQRAFQGSARIVTTADEVFAELLQIV